METGGVLRTQDGSVIVLLYGHCHSEAEAVAAVEAIETMPCVCAWLINF